MKPTAHRQPSLAAPPHTHTQRKKNIWTWDCRTFLFKSLHFTLWVNEDFCPRIMRMATHMIPNTGQVITRGVCLCDIHTQPREEATACYARAEWTQEQSEYPRMVGGRLVVTRGWWDPDSFRRVSLPCLTNSVVWQETELHLISDAGQQEMLILGVTPQFSFLTPYYSSAESPYSNRKSESCKRHMLWGELLSKAQSEEDTQKDTTEIWSPWHL